MIPRSWPCLSDPANESPDGGIQRTASVGDDHGRPLYDVGQFSPTAWIKKPSAEKSLSVQIAALYTGYEVGMLVTNFLPHGYECLDQWGGAPAPSDAKLRTLYLFEHSVHQ